MGRPREHDEKTAAALLDAAERIIAGQGADALSLRDLAREAGTTTRAVYSLFGSKDGLLGALGVRAFNLLEREVETLPPSDPPGENLVEAALVFRRFALEHPALFSIAFHDADPAISPRFRAARLDALAALHTLFEPLDDAGLLGDRTVAEAATQFGALTEGLAWTDLRCSPLPPNPEQFWRSAVHALITGFAAPTPRHTSRTPIRTAADSRDS
jgi:AcrR family transcriptional regulator